MQRDWILVSPFVRAAFCLTIYVQLAVCCVAQNGRADLAKTLTDALRPDRVLKELKNEPLSGEINSEAAVAIAEQLGKVSWSSSIEEVGTVLETHLSTAELEEVAKFLSTASGQKFLEIQPKVAAKLALPVVYAKSRAVIEAGLDRQLAQILKNAEPAGREAIQNAIKAKPIDAQVLTGRWYTKEAVSGEYDFAGWHEKRLDGSNLSVGIYIDHLEKTFDKFREPGIWKIRGKLVIEANYSDPSTLNLFIVDEVSKDRLSWRVVDEYSEPADWLKSLESRDAVVLPTAPAGYDAVELNSQ